MSEKFKTYFATLERLSTEELDASVEKLVRAEKRNVALVIAHIAEMSRRKAALERGYKNLFDYCVRRLNLSEGSVARRLQVANVSRRVPQILVALAQNRMSLTVAGLLAAHATEDTVEKLLADCAGSSKREVEEYLVTLKPKPVFEPSIRRAPSRGHAAIPPTPAQTIRPAAAPDLRPVTMSPPILEPAQPDQFNFRFAADRAFKEKFERLAEVLGVEHPSKYMAEILEQAVDIALDKKDLKRKRERRLQREARRAGDSDKRPAGKPCPGKIPVTNPAPAPAPSRYLAAEVRERVHARAGHQCEYLGQDGTRCRSRTGLEIEHTRPFALFRNHDERFLKLFCGPHNRLSAERAYGAAFIQDKIDASRRSAEARPG